MEKKREGDREAAGEIFLSSDPLYHCFFIGDGKGKLLNLLSAPPCKRIPGASSRKLEIPDVIMPAYILHVRLLFPIGKATLPSCKLVVVVVVRNQTPPNLLVLDLARVVN
jgi:hypothetical protein